MANASGDRWVTGDAYEAYMGRWSRPLARVFIEWLHPRPSANWLEVGCGTGALTSAICDLCDPASVVACDPSGPFIEHARRNFADARVSFIAAGAEALPNRDGGFDQVVSGLVLNFLPDPAQAVASMRKRLRPQGTVAAYVWDYAEGMELLRSFWEEAVDLDRAQPPSMRADVFRSVAHPRWRRFFEKPGLGKWRLRRWRFLPTSLTLTTTGRRFSAVQGLPRAMSRRWIRHAGMP